MNMQTVTGERGSQGGFVLLAVLFVLLALLILCAPFLMTARNADKASMQLVDRAQGRLLLDGAARHARVQLGASHPGGGDETRGYDSLEELSVDNHFDPGFLNAADPTGAMWDLEVWDIAGFIDLNSASPQVIANMLGMTSRIREVADGGASDLRVYDVKNFGSKAGFLVINGEVVHYNGVDEDKLTGLERGVGAYQDEDDEWATEGPRPPTSHGVGSHVLDQRAFAPVVWRIASADDRPREFDTLEQLRESDIFALAGALGDEAYVALADLGTVHGGVRAGSRWHKSVRLTSNVEGGVDQEIRVDDPRYFNEGSTVWIGDGTNAELRYVQRRTREGTIILNRVLDDDYDAFEAEVRVLARRPVNLNTAPPAVLEALFLNLQIRDRNSRITPSEAAALAGLTVQSRPFTGLEDWMRRLVLPVAGIEALPSDAEFVPDELALGDVSIIDPTDALALYVNGLNANDASLSYATMPFSFSSRDVYAMELRVSLNAPSGLERTRAVRDRVELVVPQRELFSMWSTQADFDDALRLTRNSPWFATGPSSTTRYDGSTVPPSRLWPHMGTLEGRPYLPGFGDAVFDSEGGQRSAEHVFASSEEDGWVSLWPSRVPEQGRFVGRMLHFDHETRDLEGRYLPDQTVARDAGDDLVRWAFDSEGGLMRAMSLSMWIKPQSLGEGVLLDVGGADRETDRVTLLLEGEDLVFRVLDGFGDHIATDGFREATEVRFALSGDGPGLPVDTWSHIQVDMSGSRPDQVHMLVNGTAHGVRRPGLTRLAAPASQGSGVLVVESTEGFPAQCVVRLGNELVECTVTGETTLDAAHLEEGSEAGFGGRLARTRWTAEGVPANLGSITTDHPSGTTVSVYGYSASLASNLPAGSSALPSDLGVFKVARCIGLDPQGPVAENIQIAGETIGKGLEADILTGLMLALGDAWESDLDGSQVMSAFDPSGGYAAIVQQRTSFDGTGRSSKIPNGPLGGLEIIRYSGYTQNVLNVVARGAEVASELPRYAAQDPDGLMGGSRVYITDWETTQNAAGLFSELMDMAMYVVPISISSPGADDLTYLLPEEDRSEFAQLTRLDDAEMTEWVRYDTLQSQQGQLVRDEENALLAVYITITNNRPIVTDGVGQPNTGGPGNPPGGPGNGLGGPGGPGGPASGAGSPPPAANSAGSSTAAGPVWDPLLGTGELDELPLSLAVSDAFQFRGVLGTHSHEHPAGTLLLPVFRMPDRGVDGGLPGARDAVFVSGPEVAHVGWPLVVHRAHLPADGYERHTWSQPTPGVNVAETGGGGGTGLYTGFVTFEVLVALQTPCPEPIAQGSVGGTVTDPRLLARLCKWPCAERPRVVDRVTLGTAFDGQGGVPDAVLDEVVFGDPLFLTGLAGASPASHTQAAAMILVRPMDESTEIMDVAPDTFLVAGGRWGVPVGMLGQLPDDGGLLRVGDEIMAYMQRNVNSGELLLAPGGRGMLGTRAQPHQITEAVHFLEHMVVSTLSADIGPGDPLLPIAGMLDFPFQGTVLIGEELIHYTRLRRGSLEMPQASTEAGARDGEGDGLFRGRYGTIPAAHVAGTPVILFPFRYWDRWAERADAPELAYFGLELDQPGAWWTTTFWDSDTAPSGQCQIGVLQRTDPSVPWDEDPDLSPALTLTYQGREGGQGLPLGVQSDSIEWRVFVRYDRGAFDVQDGLSHGWKETPRLRRLGASYYAPGRVLRSIDR